MWATLFFIKNFKNTKKAEFLKMKNEKAGTNFFYCPDQELQLGNPWKIICTDQINQDSTISYTQNIQKCIR